MKIVIQAQGDHKSHFQQINQKIIFHKTTIFMVYV